MEKGDVLALSATHANVAGKIPAEGIYIKGNGINGIGNIV